MVPAKHRSAQGAPGVAYLFHDICLLEDFNVRRWRYYKLRGCQTVDTTGCFSREDRPSPAVLLMTETGYLSQEVGPSPDVFLFWKPKQAIFYRTLDHLHASIVPHQ